MKTKNQIREVRAMIQNLTQQLSELEKQCDHEDTKTILTESFAFEYCPIKVCCDCSASLTVPSSAEIKEIYGKELVFYRERELTTEEIDEFYLLHPFGFNIKDIINE